MKRLSADTHFFIALLNARDREHAKAVQVESGPRLHLVTTRWVLVETADAIAAPICRARAAKPLGLAKTNPRLTILGESDALFENGCDLYASRPDKEWSLTVSISFAVMGDQHFEQAGFAALLKRI